MIIDFSKYKVRITDKYVNEAFAEKVKIHKIIDYVQDKINTVFKKALCEELENIRKEGGCKDFTLWARYLKSVNEKKGIIYG